MIGTAAFLVALAGSPEQAIAAQETDCNNKACQDASGGQWQNCVQTTNGPSTNCKGGGEGGAACKAVPCDH